MVGRGLSDSYLSDDEDGFEVQCHTLPHWIATHNLTNDRLFIKMDAEGSEWRVLSSISDWVRSLQNKPTIFFSTHTNLTDVDQVLDLCNQYQYFVEVADSKEGYLHPPITMHATELRPGTDYLLTNLEPIR